MSLNGLVDDIDAFISNLALLGIGLYVVPMVVIEDLSAVKGPSVPYVARVKYYRHHPEAEPS